ncbi:MAG: helical backbone metal receptor [Acidobacteriota bacterium]|nr:helical backbone metal receptor [Acidobacteriota bacterium]
MPRPASFRPPSGAAVLVLALAAAVSGCARESRQAPPASPVPAARVVSLAPNLTEIVFAVGAGDRLVGVSDFSDFPPGAKAIPRVGGVDMSAERIASLRPDLVLATGDAGSPRGAALALQAAGVPVLTVPTASLDQVLAAIRLIGARIGHTEQSTRLAAELEKRREAVRRGAASRRKARAVLLVWPEPPQAAGGGTFLDDVLSEAGAVNLLGDRPGWPLVSEEWLATAPIEVTVIPDSEANRPVYDRAFATGPLSRGSVARAPVLRLDESVLTRPGPRVFDALEILARDLPK